MPVIMGVGPVASAGMFGGLILLVIVGTTIWVYADAKSLGVRRGVLGGGFLDSGPGEWAAGCLLVWIIVFPLYLGTRPKYAELRRAQVSS